MRNASVVRGFQKVGLGLRILFWCYVAAIIASITSRLATNYLLDQLRDSTMDTTAFSQLFDAVTRTYQFLWLGIGIAMVVGAAKLSEMPPEIKSDKLKSPYRDRATEPHTSPLRNLANVVFVALIVSTAAGLLSSVFYELVHTPSSGGDSGWANLPNLIWLFTIIADTAASVLLVVWATRAAKPLKALVWPGLPPLIIALIGGRDVLWIWRVTTEAKSSELPWYPWASILLSIGIDISFILLLLALIRAASQAAKRAADEAETADDHDGSVQKAPRLKHHEDEPLWNAASEGLLQYADALKAKIAILVTGYIILFGASMSKSIDLVKGIMFLLPIITIIVGIVMILGLIKLAKLPSDTEAVEPTMLAIIISALAATVDIYSLTVVLDLTSSRLSKVFDAVDKLPYVEMISQALALCGLLALLAAFRRIARYIGQDDLKRRAGSIGVVLVVMICVAMGLRLSIISKAIKGETLLVFAIPVLIGAIVVVVQYLGLLRDLHASIVQWTHQPDEGERA